MKYEGRQRLICILFFYHLEIFDFFDFLIFLLFGQVWRRYYLVGT